MTIKTALVTLALATVARLPAMAADVVIAVQQDAPIHVNWDPIPPSAGADQNNDSLSPNVRFAPTGRDDSFRSAPGVIEEERSGMEFNLSSIAAAYPAGVVGSATLKLKVWKITSEIPWPVLNVQVRGYAGDGNVTTSDFGAPFSALALTELGSIPVSVGGVEISKDVTSFVNGLLSQGASWAGFNLKIDFNSVPPRSSLATDTTFGCAIFSADSGEGPILTVTPPTPVQSIHVLENLVFQLLQSGGLTAERAGGLLEKLQSADAAASAGHLTPAMNIIGAFTNQVNAFLHARVIAPTDAQKLLAIANAIFG